MIRKITFIMVLLLLIGSCLLIIFGSEKFITDKFETVSELKQASEELEKNYIFLQKAVSQDMPSKKKILSSTIEQYETTKTEYEQVTAQYAILNSIESLEQGKDIYDVDFLWTIVGNYATEEGVNLKFDVTRNTTSPQAYNNDSEDYVVCDLNFTVTGPYINLTDFIYDIEDDDRLNFEINNFSMEENLEATEEERVIEPLKSKFIVYAIKLNKNTLIEDYVVINNQNEQNPNDAIITNDTSNTTNTANTTNTSINTTKVTNQNNSTNTSRTN